MSKKPEPWQTGATELIESAIQDLHRGTEADTRIAFLLFDVGVETALKTYLKLSAKVTGTKLSYSDRKKAAEGSFHDVVDGVDKAAVGKLAGIDLNKVLYFHEVRNKLYHDGSGITVTAKDVNAYAQIAVGLLKALLGADLKQLLRQPEIQSKRQARAEAKIRKEQEELDAQTKAVQQARENLEQVARRAIEKVHPGLALPSFEDAFKKLVESHLSDEQLGERLAGLVLAVTSGSIHIEPTHLYFFKKSLYSFNLLVLESAIGPLASPNEQSWVITHFLSTNYPTNDQQSIHLYNEDPDSGEVILDEIFEPPHVDVLKKGQTWVARLNAISQLITEWAHNKQ